MLDVPPVSKGESPEARAGTMGASAFDALFDALVAIGHFVDLILDFSDCRPSGSAVAQGALEHARHHGLDG
jgi:hypothetical protein